MTFRPSDCRAAVTASAGRDRAGHRVDSQLKPATAFGPHFHFPQAVIEVDLVDIAEVLLFQLGDDHRKRLCIGRRLRME